MTLNLKLTCIILLSLFAHMPLQSVLAQGDEELPELAQNLSKLYIAAPGDSEKSLLPPTLVAPSIRLGEEGSPPEQLLRTARLINDYLQPLIDGQGKELFSELIDTIQYSPEFEDLGAIPDEDLIDFGIALITELAKVNNAILPADYKPELATNPNGSSYFSFAAFSLVALLNDLKCKTVSELLKAAGQKLVDVNELVDVFGKLGELAYCEVPKLGKISNWAFNPKDRTGEFSLKDMKVDRYRIFNEDTASTGDIEYFLVEQLSYDWELSINAYDVSIRRTEEDYEFAISTGPDADPDADPFYEPIPPRVLDDSVPYPSLPAQVKNHRSTNPETIWNRSLRLRVFSHGMSIVPERVVKTRYDIIYKDKADQDINKMDANAAELESKLDKLVSGEFKVSDDIYGRSFYRFMSEGSTPEELGPDHPFRQKSEESCIDIMFDAGTVPLTFDEFPKDQIGWCLGRCAKPLIANSK